jgi:hypothetical protein
VSTQRTTQSDKLAGARAAHLSSVPGRPERYSDLTPSCYLDSADLGVLLGAVGGAGGAGGPLRSKISKQVCPLHHHAMLFLACVLVVN